MREFLSAGAQNIVSRLYSSAKGEGASYTPSTTIKGVDTRVATGEGIPEWFIRVADSVGGPEQCQISEHIALIGCVKWKGGEIVYANLQAVAAVDGTIDDLYLGDDVGAQYFRLEFDLSKPGPMFKEPLPHVHTLADGPPRFPMSTCSPQTLVVDFLEFLYTNFHHGIWMEWARATWRENTIHAEENDPFERIVAAYQAGQTDVLRGTYSTWIEALKQVLRNEKKRMVAGYASIGADAALLTY